MNILTIPSLGLLLLFVHAGKATAQEKKYGIKSGIINFETITTVGSTVDTTRQIVYFDDYGKKECKEEFVGATLKETYFSDGKNLYRLIHADKIAYRAGKAVRGTEFRYDWNEVPEVYKRGGDARKLANMMIAGKNCETFQQKDSGMTATFAGWNHIVLFTGRVSSTVNSVSRAVKVEDNASVPPEKFTVPSGFRIK